MYLFVSYISALYRSDTAKGGRLVAERRMVADLYVFDLESSVWEKIPSHPEDDIPRARYFHSADTCTYIASLF